MLYRAGRVTLMQDGNHRREHVHRLPLLCCGIPGSVVNCLAMPQCAIVPSD